MPLTNYKSYTNTREKRHYNFPVIKLHLTLQLK